MSRNKLILVLAAFWLILAGLVGYFLYAPGPSHLPGRSGA
jgi:hypothetical protein